MGKTENEMDGWLISGRIYGKIGNNFNELAQGVKSGYSSIILPAIFIRLRTVLAALGMPWTKSGEG